jgi:hypothetical protein
MDAPHGMCTTLMDQINEDLLEFIKGRKAGKGSMNKEAGANRDCDGRTQGIGSILHNRSFITA